MTEIRVGPDFERRYPDASRAATECAMNVVRTGDLVVDRVADLVRPLGLTPASGLVLAVLVDAGRPLPPSEIGERLIVTRATVTGLVDSLERRGLVRRRPHPDDRRMLLVELTARGRRLVPKMRAVVHRHQRGWFSPLSADEQETLIRLLGRVQGHLGSLPRGE